ncbi:LysR family transcriptional regulator [Paenibacillus larvae]
MDIRHLKYFIEVVRCKSFTKASDVLHITQPTISKMIKNIEDELGVVLLDRSTKQVMLTDAGQSILLQAQQIVKSFENLSIELANTIHLKKGKIRMGLPPMVGSRFFPHIIGEFHHKYPNIEIQLIEEGAKKVEEQVEEGHLDIGVVLLPIPSGTFDSFPFVHEKLMVVVYPKHRLAGQTVIALKKLEHEPFILFREGFVLHDRIPEECIRAGFQPKVVYESSQWDFISEMVAAGLGISMLPESICRELNPNRVITIPLVEPSIDWSLAMIWPKEQYISYAVREWINFVKQRLQPKEA